MRIFSWVLSFLFCSAYLFGTETAKCPWWDSFPRIIQDPLKDVVSHHGNIWMGGGGQDPFYGLYFQRQTTIHAARDAQAARDAGVKKIVWYEGFGTAHSYIAQVKRNEKGDWIKNGTDSTWTQLVRRHADWEKYDGEPVVRWIGIVNHFEDDAALKPWTRSHREYGCPPMTYPDGRIATGSTVTQTTDQDVLFGPETDPRTSRVFDAGCSKDVFGNVFFEYGYNAAVNRIDPTTRKPVGPLAGLIAVKDAPIGTPDPGFTPEEWKKAKTAGYAGDVYSGKDIACPMWNDYLDASIRHAIKEADIDGLWVDNFSPWDNFNSRPIERAFGEWTVAGFRAFLTGEWKTKIPADVLPTVDPESFDVRKYVVAKYREWGGTGDSLKDCMRNPAWRDRRWQDDPIWRAFLVYKRRVGTEGLTRFYETVKKRGAELGKPDILVTGNDMPMFSLGWVRDNLDMVSTELSWGWGNTAGPRGLMPPPQSGYVAVYRLAREHAKSRFVNVWMYVPTELIGKPNIGHVLHYQGLANHTMPKAQLTPRHYGSTAGSPEGVAEFFSFVEKVEPIFRDRKPVDGKIGVFYSSSSQLYAMVPGGYPDHTHQEHSFAFFGWGTALTKKQIPWRAIPEWKLTPETLDKLSVLILPYVIAIDDADIETLARWVDNGGRLIVGGKFAPRHGEERNFDGRNESTSPFLSACLQAARQGRVIALGKGWIVGRNNDPGLAYYKEDARRAELIERIESLLQKIDTAEPKGAIPDYISVPKDFPFGVDITLHRDARRVFVDLNNTQIDVKTDTVTESGPLRFEILLPENWDGNTVDVTVFSPHGTPKATIKPVNGGRLAIDVDNIRFYTCLVLEPK